MSASKKHISDCHINVVCIDNKPHFYRDGSSDNADEYLTIGKVYRGHLGIDDPKSSGEGDNIFIQDSDRREIGWKWWTMRRFKLLSEVREEKLNNMGI